jgi:hypothetical protein
MLAPLAASLRRCAGEAATVAEALQGGSGGRGSLQGHGSRGGLRRLPSVMSEEEMGGSDDFFELASSELV